MADGVINFPTNYVSLGQAVGIVKHKLSDPDVPIATKMAAMERVALMETHNSITKDDPVNMLKFIFFHYDFGEG